SARVIRPPIVYQAPPPGAGMSWTTIDLTYPHGFRRFCNFPKYHNVLCQISEIATGRLAKSRLHQMG
ncbi:hypothetical protein BGZ90_008115, partial [Linnemannia elongata]